MLKEQAKIFGRLHKLLDMLITAMSFYLAYLCKIHVLPAPYRGLVNLQHDYAVLMLLILVIWHFTLRAHGVYGSFRPKPLTTVMWRCTKAVSIGMLLLFMGIYLFKIEGISRILLGLFYLINLGLLFASKGIALMILRRYRSRGYNFRNMLIIGCGHSAQAVMAAVAEEPWSGYKIIGCLDAPGCQIDKAATDNVRVIGTYDDLEQIIFKEVVDELVFATDLKEIPDVIKYVELADEMGIAVRILPQWNIRRLGINPQIGTLKYENFLGVPTLGIDSSPENQGEMAFKSLLDYAVAMVGIIITLPIWIMAAIGIKLVSPGGPVLYKQTRVGQNGREFTLFKFRTMVPDADQQFKQYETQNECDGPVFKLKKDPRVLPVIGSLLRKSSLDELPQLVNVLKGELSIVGPRPPLPKEVKCYQYWQRRRLSMKPGITCYWQVQPKRNEISFEDWMKMDLAYIDNWSLWLDFKIMVRTAWVMLIGAGR